MRSVQEAAVKREAQPEVQPLGLRLGDLSRRAFVEIGLLPIMLIALIAIFAIAQPRFVSGANITNLAQQVTFLMLVTMGQALVLISGNLDLSVGSTIAFTTVITGLVLTWDPLQSSPELAIVLAFLVSIAVGLGVGFANGFATAVLKVPSFIVTFAMLSALFGASLILTRGFPITGFPREFTKTLGTQRVAEIPVPVFFMVAALIVYYVLLNWSRLGRYIYAVGGNSRAAHVSGVPVTRVLIYIFMMCSTLAAIAGWLLAARLSSGEATAGAEFPLESIAAAVIGGVALTGGKGRVRSVVLGVIFITVLSNGMDLVRIQSYYQLLALAALIVLAVVADQAREQLRL